MGETLDKIRGKFKLHSVPELLERETKRKTVNSASG